MPSSGPAMVNLTLLTAMVFGTCASVGAEDQPAGVREEAADSEKGGRHARVLVVAGLPLELQHGLTDVTASLGPPVGEAPAVRVDRDAPVDQDPVLLLVPVVLDERARFADAA